MALEQLPVEQKETMLPGCIEDMSYQERLLWGFIASRKKYFCRGGAPVPRFTGNELNPKKILESGINRDIAASTSLSGTCRRLYPEFKP